jgi:RNA polymerase sigma-70 factor (ECF subfamily)
MQQAYVDAYAHLVQWKGTAQFSTWLTRIAYHEALSRARKRRRETPVGSRSEPEEDVMSLLRSPSPSPEHQAFQGEMRAHLEAAIDALPRLYRAAFVMRDVEGLSTAETASCLGVREDTVKTRLHRARALIREELYRRVGTAAGNTFTFERPRCDRVVRAVFDRLRLSDEPIPH